MIEYNVGVSEKKTYEINKLVPVNIIDITPFSPVHKAGGYPPAEIAIGLTVCLRRQR